MTREDLLRAIVADAYELARSAVYDLPGWSPGMALTSRERRFLQRLEAAEANLECHRISALRLMELVDAAA